MGRDLSDVFHYFIPEGDSHERRPPALPIVAVPIGDRDVVRAALLWNLTVEVARLGGSASLVGPANGNGSSLWPEAGRGPVGAELIVSDAARLADLNRAALDVAVTRAADASDGGLVLVHVPPDWLRDAAEGRALLRWMLLLSSSDQRDLVEAYGLAKRVVTDYPKARVGVTIHGVRRVGEAEHAFNRICCAAERHLSRPLTSYGLLVDNLNVYRAIVARRPVGLSHPQSPAAKALRDVARLLLSDAREQSGG